MIEITAITFKCGCGDIHTNTMEAGEIGLGIQQPAIVNMSEGTMGKYKFYVESICRNTGKWVDNGER